MKKCDCLPVIKNVWCKDPHCNDDRIPIAVDMSGNTAKVIMPRNKFVDKFDIGEPLEIKVKVNNYKL